MTLIYPTKGDDVSRLQALLAMLGYKIAVDGDFGVQTREMVKRFQSDTKLQVDGRVGPKTWAALDKAVKAKPASLLHGLALALRNIFGKLPTGFEQFEWGNAGGTQTPVWTNELLLGSFVDGWWSEAFRYPTHPGRVGPTIIPKSTVVHTTDCAPGTMATLLINCQKSKGDGGGFHFLIGKRPRLNPTDISGGVAQLVPITKNGNHAGGRPSHGWFKLPGGSLIHPNTVTVGIELDNAGLLKGKPGAWIHKDSGRKIPDADVFVDARGRGWERVTDYQFAALVALLDALEAMPRMPEGTTVVPNGTYVANGVPEAAMSGVRVVGHWTIDPARKTDPGPQVTEWIRNRHDPN